MIDNVLMVLAGLLIILAITLAIALACFLFFGTLYKFSKWIAR